MESFPELKHVRVLLSLLLITFLNLMGHDCSFIFKGFFNLKLKLLSLYISHIQNTSSCVNHIVPFNKKQNFEIRFFLMMMFGHI